VVVDAVLAVLGTRGSARLIISGGFADQAHLCRTVRDHLGHTPDRAPATAGRKAVAAPVQVASAGVRPNVGTRLGSLNAVMRAIRALIGGRTWTPYAWYRPSPARS
jgi:hypothetical protein